MEASIAASILRNLGLTGSGLATGSLVPPSSVAASTGRMDKMFNEAGDLGDVDAWNKYTMLLKRPTTYEQMLQLWDEMSSWDLVSAALAEIVEEACTTDPSSPSVLWYECNDAEFEDELNTNLLPKLDIEQLLPSQIWHLAAFGNSFEKLECAKKEGVMGFSFVHPIEMRRYWLEKNRQCVGYRWMGHLPNKENVYVGPNGAPISRIGINIGSQKVEDLYYPWDFLHMRRMYRTRASEHGEPIFDDAQGVYKKLRLALDMMVVLRAQVQPDRYIVNIDVQDLPPREQTATVQRWKQSLRSRLSFGQGTTETPNDFKSFYNAMALDTVLWMARPRGFNHTIEKIPGTTAVPDIYDIELLENLFFSIIGMPKWWVMGMKEGAAAPSGKALLATDMRFLRKIKAIRRPIRTGYTWLGYFHALLKGKDLSQLDLKVQMSPIGGLEDQMKMESLKAQVEVLDMMADLMEKFKLPREAWIDVVFKKYLHLPDEIVNVFMTSLPAPAEPTEESKSKVRVANLLNEVDRRLGNKYNRIRKQIHRIMDGNLPQENTTKYKSPSAVMNVADDGNRIRLNENDIIRSSFQNDEVPLKISGMIAKGEAKSLTESKPEPAYRRYVKFNS